MTNPGSIRWSVMRVVLVATLSALLVNALALTWLDMYEYRDAELAGIRVQADMLARASAAAVAFSDQDEAANAIRLVERNPRVRAAALYLADGSLFASFARRGVAVPERSGGAGLALDRDLISGFHTVEETGGPSSTVYLSAESDFSHRLIRYLRILTIVMAGALLFALVLSHRLQRAVTTPILTVADAARRVIEQHDYGVRVAPPSGKEAALLADAFNQMLAEIDKRTSSLEEEMAERRQAEQALLEADRRKDEFLATLAHELRNPLAPIVTAVEVLKRLGAEGPQRNAHDVIDRQARHMTRLLDDLLDVARITNGKVQLQLQRLSLASVLDAAIESTRHLIENARHRLALHLPDQPIHVHGDAVRLAQVFTNLLTNACKYMEPGGTITVSLAASGDLAKVVVADAGVGIRKQDQARVFALFTQSEASTGRFDGGLGIGLFLVRTFTEMHGGTVAVESEGLGKGTTFTVHLPVMPPSPVELRPPIRASAPRHDARRILVADDNRDAAETLASFLRLNGCDVRIALDGDSALAFVTEFMPDTAILDIGMPGISGYEVARRVRGLSLGKRIRLVALTGWGADQDKKRASESGFDHHLTKPARLEDIEAILDLDAGPEMSSAEGSRR